MYAKSFEAMKARLCEDNRRSLTEAFAFLKPCFIVLCDHKEATGCHYLCAPEWDDIKLLDVFCAKIKTGSFTN